MHSIVDRENLINLFRRNLCSQVATSASLAKRWLWYKDLRLDRNGSQVILLVILAGLALFAEIVFHANALSIPRLLTAEHVTVFYNVEDIDLHKTDGSVASIVIYAAIARVLFGILVAIADLIFYKRITGRAFDWESMINLSVVNCVFLLTILFTFLNPAFKDVLVIYEHLISRVPTIANFTGVPALLVACLIGDFCFYWSHRWCHKIRFFWNLGHSNHHRSRNLSQLTQVVDPQSFILDTAGGKVFVLLLLPVLTKLFAVDLRDCGWWLIVAMILDIWTNPSHSVVLYQLETRVALLRIFRYVFVTPAVHFTHHSREQAHNISDGCNFASRLSIWDRLFGTYVEPPSCIPETGLFSDDTDYCNTPLRFIFLPWLKLARELRYNELRDWTSILFAHASYEPPVVVKEDGSVARKVVGSVARNSLGDIASAGQIHPTS